MTVRAVLHELEFAGIRLTLAGDDLRYQTRPGISIADHRERITAHKLTLVRLLRQGQPIDPTRPLASWDGSLCVGCRWPTLCSVLGPRGPHLAEGPCPAWPASEGVRDRR